MRRRIYIIAFGAMVGVVVTGGLALGVFIAIKFAPKSAAPAHTAGLDGHQSPSLTISSLNITLKPPPRAMFSFLDIGPNTTDMFITRRAAPISAKSSNTSSFLVFRPSSFSSLSTEILVTSESSKSTATTSSTTSSSPTSSSTASSSTTSSSTTSSSTTSSSTTTSSTTSSANLWAAPTGGGSGASCEKKTYTGDGDRGWPTRDEWLSIGELWSKNYDIMGKYCSDINGVATMPTSDTEKAAIKAAIIKSASENNGLDARFIFAVMMQESEGCVRTVDTHSPDGIRNPGLMQSHNGKHACYSLQEACPDAMIAGMIMDGAGGTADQHGGGDGLVQCLAKAKEMGAKEGSAQQYYIAARLYNSGPNSYTFGKPLENGQTSSYVSDIANRFRGCVG
ncbi:hypothetical protein LARI1_G004879 [Lachnellula arida]|uniref:Transglycosylase SLT domain-containing protein n=1 Tax=Lachnellula arida TaxID=1316785 RepID=A0A8T9BH95_9HELO|nr:hypothetical protein LARI1_G004879 [Lachnellula arida]